MTSRLGYAILALLARQPSTGYELSQRAHRPLGYFWTARHSQIYPELAALLEAGLVRYDAAPGPGPREKKVYSLTGAGRRELADWVPRPPVPDKSRDDELLKAYAAWAADPDAVREMLRDRVAEHEKRLAEYQAQQHQVERRHRGGAPPATHPDFASYATLKYGIGYEAWRIRWLRWMIGQVGQRQADDRQGMP